jgi:hypothetical protein
VYAFGEGVSFATSRKGETPSAYPMNLLTLVLLF